MKPVFLIVRLEFREWDEYVEKYGLPVLAMFEDVGAEVIAASAPEVLEGVWSGNWTALIRFPSMEVALAFYRSPQYQPLKALRINELTENGTAVLVDGFDPAALGIDISR